MAQAKQFLADWICYTAEKDVWWVCLRPWSTRDRSWAEWHEARFEATGDEEELVRMERHQQEGDAGCSLGRLRL